MPSRRRPHRTGAATIADTLWAWCVKHQKLRNPEQRRRIARASEIEEHPGASQAGVAPVLPSKCGAMRLGQQWQLHQGDSSRCQLPTLGYAMGPQAMNEPFFFVRLFPPAVAKTTPEVEKSVHLAIWDGSFCFGDRLYYVA